MAATEVDSQERNSVSLHVNGNPHSKAPKKRNHDSITQRRNRGISTFLFEEIAGKKLKCYEKWKLWMALFFIMTVIAVAALVFSTVLAVKHSNIFKTKSEAMAVEYRIIEELFNGSNATDHIDQVRQIFNTFDDDKDGVWDPIEFADHLYRATETEAIFDNIDLDSDNILSFGEVTIAKSREPDEIAQLFANEYSGAINDSLYWQYSASIFFNKYNGAQKGYITRDDYYQYHANSHFIFADIDSNGYIDFDEFTANTIDSDVISLLQTPSMTSLINNIILQPLSAQRDNPYSNTSYTEMMQSLSLCSSSFLFNHRRLYKADWVYNDGEREIVCESSDLSMQKIFGCGDALESSDTFPCVKKKMEDKELGITECKVAVELCTPPKTWKLCIEECYCGCNRRRRRELLGCNCVKCFGPNNEMVIKRDNEIHNILLAELIVGDFVESKNGEWTKVWWIKKKEEHVAHLQLYVGANEYITVTPNHLLYVDVMEDEYMKRAGDVRIGSVLFVMDKDRNRFVEKKVLYIDEIVETITFAPVTMDGTIVVNGVLASAYEGNKYWEAKQYHESVAIIRFVSRYINQDLAVYLTDLNYYLFFQTLQKYDLHFVLYNWYFSPIIAATNFVVPLYGLSWITRKLWFIYK